MVPLKQLQQDGLQSHVFIELITVLLQMMQNIHHHIVCPPSCQHDHTCHQRKIRSNAFGTRLHLESSLPSSAQGLFDPLLYYIRGFPLRNLYLTERRDQHCINKYLFIKLVYIQTHTAWLSPKCGQLDFPCFQLVAKIVSANLLRSGRLAVCGVCGVQVERS